MSGIAQIFQATTGDQYVAGLWRDDLVRGFMWRHMHELGPLYRDLQAAITALNLREQYIAPSWSWIGHRYLEYMPCFGGKMEQDCNIIDVSTSASGRNPFGRLDDGELKVNGHTISPNLELPAKVRRHEM
ncbi:hypothetical protein ACJ41O_006292 [Fusarium nematophilum]